MRRRASRILWLTVGLMLASVGATRAELLINEVLFNPSSGDTTNEYVELRGTPNMMLPNGTYLLSVEGDAEDDPGTIQNIFAGNFSPGINPPLTIDLVLLKLTFGFSLKVSLLSVLGMFLGAYLYKQM